MKRMKRDVKNKRMRRRGRIGNKGRRIEGYKGVVYYTLYDKPKQRSTRRGDNGTMRRCHEEG